MPWCLVRSRSGGPERDCALAGRRRDRRDLHTQSVQSHSFRPGRRAAEGGEIAAKSLDAEIVHFIPRSEAPAEQLGLVDEVVRIKPDAIVFAPFDPKAMVPAIDKLNAAGIPVTNVNERLAGGNVVAYVGT